MKSFINLALATMVALAVADDVSCESDDYNSVVSNAVVTNTTSTATPTANITKVYAPNLAPGVDTQDTTWVVPQKHVSLYYDSNTTTNGIHVNHTLKYPAVLLEQIAAVSNVDCTSSSVAVTFNDSAIFASTEAAWSAEGTFVLITNHLGDCDPELERGFFLVGRVSYDNTTLVATASSAKTNVSSTAGRTQISFGTTAVSSPTKRDLTLDPSYTIDTTLALTPDTTIYSYSPYVTVTADVASFTGATVLSGYLDYNWLLFKLEDLYFDIDASFSADLALSVEVGDSYSTTFSYAPAALFYGLSVPGVLELGPQLQFGVDAYLSAAADVILTTELTTALADGNVHLDLLDESNTSTSGWVPTYTASINVTGEVEVEVNPAATLTVEIAIDFFSGLLDLSTGLTASAGFDNSLTLTGGVGVDLIGVTGLNSTGGCTEGLKIDSDFVFSVVGFATEWVSDTLYSVDIPLLDKCYSWE